ncbi:MAG: hypothetical protein WBR26_04370 [Candidatus Acidiferrum sp.]
MNRPCEKSEKKKPYQPPKLLIYGNLTDMTKSRGYIGRKDVPKGPYRNTGK